MVILVPEAGSADEIARLAELRFGASPPIVVAYGDATPVQSVTRARSQHGGAPLAYAARSDAEALDAIGAGADEAMHLPSYDAHHVLLLLDRASQRASLRRAQENERTSAVQSEKLAALGTVVAGVAHEINNPLAAVLLSTELLRSILGPLFDAIGEVNRLAGLERPVSTDEIARVTAIAQTGAHLVEGKEVLDELTALAETIADVVRDLRIYARSDESESPQIVNVTDLIEQVLRIVGREITTRGHIERDYASALPPLVVPRSRVVQVLTNILVNAAHAIREVHRPAHRVRITVRADTEAVAISIADTGPGIAPESIERIFDPFYTTKREGAGTGLGLSISRSILRRLGGDLIVESVHGVGATFVAIIPLPQREALRDAFRRASPSARLPAAPTRRVSVLVVDDDERLLRIYPRILRERYEVLVASDGQEAIELLLSGSEVDVVVTDLAMPETDGKQLFAWLTENRPELARRTIFVTAAAEEAADLLARIPNATLEKPVSRDELFGAIEAALRAEPLARP
jgi:signal transduction histidine kinase/ActR/RegA family two-component response regulator